ncbi:MAG: hypothetical protein JF586_22685 [Burkholderiales bacterium]|nr:hypothetical protein [Burkholderiales bacterium]
MHRFLPAHALLAAAVLLAAEPARALTTSSVKLADFQISLVDLDSSDGIAPSMVFDPRLRSTVTVVDSVNPYGEQQGDAPFGAVAFGTDFDGTGGAGSFSGDPFGAGATIISSAVGSNGYAAGWSGASLTAPSFGAAEFVVSAHTQVAFSGDLSLDWSDSSTAASTFSFAELRLWRYTADGQDLIGDDTMATAYYGDGAPSGTLSAPLRLSFANDTDGTETITFELFLSSYATERESYPSPVDEPAGAALALAGAALAFWRLRRR